MKKFILLLVLFGSLISCGNDPEIKEAPLPFPKQNSKNSLQITSLNIEWYGIGGRLSGNSSSEHRDKFLKKYFSTTFKATDVFVFQEIVDDKRLQKLLPKFRCHTYDRHNPRHQHVVICSKKIFTTTYQTYFSVDLNNPGLRPAQMAEVKVNKDFSVQVVGLHLKAKPDGTDQRIDQISALKSELDANSSVVLIGDFNTYEILKTGKSKDDDDLMSDILDEVEFDQVLGDVDTFIGWSGFAQLDRAWARNLTTTKSFVHGPCDDKTKFPYNDTEYYKKNISDHCPITIVVTPPKK